jgi:hypothetical protein
MKLARIASRPLTTALNLPTSILEEDEEDEEGWKKQAGARAIDGPSG